MTKRPILATSLAATALGALLLGGPAAAQLVASVRIDEPDEKAVEVSIEKLTSVNYRKGQDLPSEIEKLDGKKIKIEGYMAIGTLEGVAKFELVPEPCECGRSKVQHFIDVTIEDGLTTYRPGRITLEGTFSCGEVEEDGFVVSLYRLTIDSLE